MIDESQINYERTVYKSGKVCYIGTYKNIVKKINFNITLLEDMYGYDSFAIRYLTDEIRKEVENKRR